MEASGTHGCSWFYNISEGLGNLSELIGVLAKQKSWVSRPFTKGCQLYTTLTPAADPRDVTLKVCADALGSEALKWGPRPRGS